MKLLPIQQRIWNLREQMKLYAVTGKYRDFAQAKIDYAKEFVSNPEAALTTPPTSKITASLFSKAFFIAYCIF